MKIYNNEIRDGIAEAMSDKTIAFECPIINEQSSPEDIDYVIASCGEQIKQDDLYYLSSVLVSAGWNKNDDVFSVQNLWGARNTPIEKPFNYMHDETDIIGHITSAIVMDQDGKVIEQQTALEDLPDKIDIITSAVIYKSWSDQEMRERVGELTQEIDKGQWSVSMECVFSDFDYALIGPDGENKTLARTEESSFLTKHLRAYGGKGEYEGYKVGRLLKGFYFSGKGLVNKPANPRSIIFSKDINPFISKANITLTNFLSDKENIMTDSVNEQRHQLEHDLETAKAELENVKTELTKEKEDTVASFESAIAEKDQIIASLETKVKELEDSLALMKEDKMKKEEEMKKMKEEGLKLRKGMKYMKRKASLTQAGLDSDAAEELLVQFEDASDEMFDSVVALVTPTVSAEEVYSEPVEEESVEEEEEATEAYELEEAEEVEETTLANDESVDEQNIMMSSASDWFSSSVLKTTKNLK